MDIARALGRGAFDDGVDQTDGRCGGRFLAANGGGGKGGVVLGLAVAFALHFLDGAGRAFVSVQGHDGAVNAVARCDHGDHAAARGGAHFFQRHKVQRIGHGEIKLILVHPHGDDLIFLCDILGQHRGHFGAGRVGRQVDKLNAKLHLKRFNQLAFADKSVFGKDGAKAFTGLLLQAKRFGKLFVRDQAVRDQKVAKAHVGHKPYPPSLRPPLLPVKLN